MRRALSEEAARAGRTNRSIIDVDVSFGDVETNTDGSLLTSLNVITGFVLDPKLRTDRFRSVAVTVKASRQSKTDSRLVAGQ